LAPGGPAFTSTQFGNLNAIVKGVMWDDPASGSLISAGATVTFPTASTQKIDFGVSTLAYLQPFAGYILSRGDWYVHGFTSVTVAVEGLESIVLFNDVGVGYYAYRDASRSGLVAAVVPTFEVHVASPLRQPNGSVSQSGNVDTLQVIDVVNLTL